MIALLAALVLQQQGDWRVSPAEATVGDTITVTRMIRAPAGSRLRPQPIAAGELVEPLADPVVVDSGGGLVIRYQLAAFQPGLHGVPIPPIEMIERDGRISAIDGDTAWLAVGSVLPQEAGARPTPRPSAAPVARVPRRPLPLFVLPGVVALITVGWAVIRRQVRPRPAPPAPHVDPVNPPIQRWIAAGEARATAAFLTQRLRERIARAAPAVTPSLGIEQCLSTLEQEHPDWPLRDLADVLWGLERARFAPATPSEIVVLADQMETVIATIGNGAGGPR